jgi:Trk K+ transport system NAD-binding subunit
MNQPSTVLIVGSGPLAVLLATRLEADGCSVAVVDRPGADFSKFPDSISPCCISGEPMNPKVLEQAGIEGADFLIAATLEDDLNLAVAMICRKLFSSRVIARVQDPTKAAGFRTLGIEICCPADLACSSITRVIEECHPGQATPGHDEGGRS